MKESPWSVIDIAPAAEMVDVQGDAVGVTTAFQPRAWRICSAGFPSSGQEVQAEQLMAMGGEAVAAIAAGCGYPGDETDSKRLVKKITHVEADALDAIKKEASRVNFG